MFWPEKCGFVPDNLTWNFILSWSKTAKRDIPQAANDQIRLFDMKARWRTDAVEWDASVLDSLNHFAVL